MDFMKVTVIHVISEGRSVIKCSYCNGTGREPFPKGKINEYFYTDKSCSICGGRGVLVVQHDDTLIKCARCDGTGHEPHPHGGYYYNKKCKTCRGSGVLSLTGKLKILTNPKET